MRPRMPSGSLDQIVEGRCRRGLTVVVDTLGLDPIRRAAWASLARRAGLATVAVVLDTPAAVCRARNAARDRPVPATVLAPSCNGCARSGPSSRREGWDVRVVIGRRAGSGERPRRQHRPLRTPDAGPTRDAPGRAFPVGEDPLEWLRASRWRPMRPGFAGIALMDHLIQIPQVGRAWEPDPRAVGDARGAGGPRHRPRAGDAVHAGDVPRSGHHRQDGRDPRRAHRRSGVLRARGGLVGPRACGVRARLPAHRTPPRRPRGRRRDAASTLGSRHQGLRGRTGVAAGDDLLPAAGRCASADHRRGRRAPYAPDRRPLGRRLQRAGRPGHRPAQDRGAASALRRRGPAPRRGRRHRSRHRRRRHRPRRHVDAASSASAAAPRPPTSRPGTTPARSRPTGNATTGSSRRACGRSSWPCPTSTARQDVERIAALARR